LHKQKQAKSSEPPPLTAMAEQMDIEQEPTLTEAKRQELKKVEDKITEQKKVASQVIHLAPSVVTTLVASGSSELTGKDG